MAVIWELSTRVVLTTTHESRNTQPPGLRFRAVLIENDVQVTFRREVHDRFDEVSL